LFIAAVSITTHCTGSSPMPPLFLQILLLPAINCSFFSNKKLFIVAKVSISALLQALLLLLLLNQPDDYCVFVIVFSSEAVIM